MMYDGDGRLGDGAIGVRHIGGGKGACRGLLKWPGKNIDCMWVRVAHDSGWVAAIEGCVMLVQEVM